VWLTVLRQSTNQGANFFVYQWLKKHAQDLQPEVETLPWWQPMAMGLVSGACGPLVNAPIDTIKTRIQKVGCPAWFWFALVKSNEASAKSQQFHRLRRRKRDGDALSTSALKSTATRASQPFTRG
jgi:solute carrier family 25 (mitochondrial citrate transporter), member 1